MDEDEEREGGKRAIVCIEPLPKSVSLLCVCALFDDLCKLFVFCFIRSNKKAPKKKKKKNHQTKNTPKKKKKTPFATKIVG